MTISEEGKAAVKKYQAGHDQVTIRPDKGTKNRWRSTAEAHGMSMTQLIIKAVEEYIQRMDS